MQIISSRNNTFNFIKCIIKRFVNVPTGSPINSDYAEYPRTVFRKYIASHRVETRNTRNAPVEIERVETAFHEACTRLLLHRRYGEIWKSYFR